MVPWAFLFQSLESSFTVIDLAQLLPGLTTTVMASKAMGSSMKLMPLSAQRFNSLLEMGRDALARGMLPLQNARNPAVEPVSLISKSTGFPLAVVRYP